MSQKRKIERERERNGPAGVMRVVMERRSPGNRAARRALAREAARSGALARAARAVRRPPAEAEEES